MNGHATLSHDQLRRLIELSFLRRAHIDNYGIDDALVEGLLAEATGAGVTAALAQLPELADAVERALTSTWMPGDDRSWKVELYVGADNRGGFHTAGFSGREIRAETADGILAAVRDLVA